jgi:glucose-1-phosphate thymidylyltransferase
VVELDPAGKPVRLIEKPDKTGASWVATGLYFYDPQVYDIAADLEPSARGELEVTDINARYLAQGELDVEILGRGSAWFDAGTIDQLLAAGNYVSMIESRQGMAIGCLEEIAYRKGFIGREELEVLADGIPQPRLQSYLRDLLTDDFGRGM